MRDYINIQADEVTISKVVDRQQSRTLFSTASQRACVYVYIFLLAPYHDAWRHANWPDDQRTQQSRRIEMNLFISHKSILRTRRLSKLHCASGTAMSRTRRVSMALSIRPIATPHCNALCIELQFVSLALTAVRDDDKNRALDCEQPRRMRDGIALSCKRKNTQIVLVLREWKRDQFSGNDALATTPDGSIFCYSLS
jgi:hypothetical protein